MASKFVLVLTILVALVVILLDVALHGHGSASHRRDQMKDRVDTAAVPSLLDLDVTVEDRTGILTGRVDTPAERRLATQAAMRTPGFLTVYNDIKVDAIEEALLAQLKQLQDSDSTPGEFAYRIGPDAHTVTLDGWVPTDKPELRQALEDMVRKIPGVRNVINNIGLGYDQLIEDINRILQMGNIYFDYDKADVRPESLPSVQKIAKLMNADKYKHLRVRIEGHTDHTASREYNLRLSDRRAAAVKDALAAAGVDAGRLESVGYGEDRPISPNITPEQRANNRRIEFKVIHGELSPPESVDRLAVDPAKEPSTTTVVPEGSAPAPASATSTR